MIFENLEKKRKKIGALSLALIDPDLKNDKKLLQIINNINQSNFDAILVGGSKIKDNNFKNRLKTIKSTTKLPIILFPGSSSQVSDSADAILFISLLSGRNVKYLIEEQVKASRYIYKHNLEVIPTGYLLFSTDKKSSVQKISKTEPLNMNNTKEIISHALAAQYLGKKILFLEAGSNSNYSIDISVIKKIHSLLNIPIMVGGGIKNKKTADNIINAGASYIVIGTLLEECNDINFLKEINKTIHGF